MSWRATRKQLELIKRARGVNKKIPARIEKWNIKKGDTVQLLAGKDKGKQGKVVVIDRIWNRVYVQGLNTHIVNTDFGQSTITGKMQKEAPIHYSNVALVDPADGEPCRIKYMYTEDGEKVRVSKRSGRIIPFPVREKKNRAAFPDGPMDTKPAAASKVTFIPSLVTFEEEILQKFGNLDISRTPNKDSVTVTAASTT